MRRLFPTLGLLAALVPTSRAGETYHLAETPAEGDCFRLTAETTVAGVLKVTRDNRPVTVKLSAKNHHALTERTLAVERTAIRRSARHYATAAARATVDGDTTDRVLRAERRGIVAHRSAEGLLCYSPAGPLTRPEAEVVSEHFDTQNLAGLLPNKAVEIADTWKIDPATAQAVCLFDGLIAHDLKGKLKEVTGTNAIVAIDGTARGIEHGAMVQLTITATATFDLTKKRIVAIDWKQKDARDPGPVTPAAEVESTTTVKREFLAAAPEELGEAELAKLPAGDDPPNAIKYLHHRDPKDRYQFLHPREWHTVAQTDRYLLMRLLDRGDFVAQATVTIWANAGAGKHMTPDEFVKIASASGSWKAEQIVERGEVPTDADRWVYRVQATGTLDGVAVVQIFYVVATAAGDQMIVTFTMKPDKVNRLGTRDVALVNGLDFPKK